MDATDLKTRQFAQVLSAVPSNEPVVLECKKLIDRAGESASLRATFVAILSFFILLLIRPPFVMSFEYDRTRPWKGRSCVSWPSVIFVVLLMAVSSFLVPMVC
jgi:hypothetical protein